MHEQGSVDWKSGFEFRNSSGMARFPLPVWDVGWLGHSIGGIFKSSLDTFRAAEFALVRISYVRYVLSPASDGPSNAIAFDTRPP